MRLYTYLNYGGNCRQAFEFYQAHLGGKITMLATHAEVPDLSKVPAEWKDAVLHLRPPVRHAAGPVRDLVDAAARAAPGLGAAAGGVICLYYICNA